ncbi:MAG TPA: DoxX family protein [Plantibacter sp.]|uniref:DoxX family protein n=1 Tax=unclassified Plantibacter TaxID=2624265 RepID=UPI002CC10778|nr:DoxX family protein [Plantibacter sp.]
MTTLTDHQHTETREPVTVPPAPVSPASPIRAAGLNTGLLLLRLVLGVILIAHGLQKVLVDGIPGVAAGFGGMGIPAPEAAAIVVVAVELLGGALLIIGLGTRVVAVLSAINMVVALLLVHLSAGFFAADGGYEFVLLLAVVSLALALTGPGRISVDTLFRRRR